MKLYGYPYSTCTRKVLMTLVEKGHKAELVVIDLGKGEQKQPAHVARQPFGLVPVLEEEDGFRLYESRAIIRYLDGKLSGPSLTPSDKRGAARMDQWINVEQSYFTPHAMKIITENVLKPMRGLSSDQAVVQKALADLVRPFEVLDEALASKPFLAGDTFSLADVVYMPYLEVMAKNGAGELIARFKNFSKWWERISTRPAWRKVVQGEF